MLLSGISEARTCIEVAARFCYLGVRMSATSSVPSSSDSVKIKNISPSIQVSVPIRNQSRTISSIDRNPYRPVNGLVGRCFIRVCLWAELLVSWKRRSYTAPAGGFPECGDSEPESEAAPHAAAS